MDSITLKVLEAELREDVRVAQMAAQLAATRLLKASAVDREGCAFQLCQFYNVFENMCLRVAKAFENHIDDPTRWHAELLRRMALSIPSVRPALLSERLVPDLQELKGFRHVVHHAYDLSLDQDRLTLLTQAADRVQAALPGMIETFLKSVGKTPSRRTGKGTRKR